MFVKTYGDKNEVWNGIAKQTRGRITKSGLKINKYGKVVFAAKSNNAIKSNSFLNLLPYMSKKNVSQRKMSSKRKSSKRKSSQRKMSSKRKSSQRKSSPSVRAGRASLYSP